MIESPARAYSKVVLRGIRIAEARVRFSLGPQMKHKRIADGITILHLMWVAFGVANLPLLFLIDTWSTTALVFVGVTVLSWAIFRGCWFLHLENKYRNLHDRDSAFEEAFIQHYLREWLGIVCSRNTVNISIYFYFTLTTAVALLQKLT